MRGTHEVRAGEAPGRTRARAAVAGATKGAKRRPTPEPVRGSVRAYVAALAPPHRALAKRFDALVRKVVPGVRSTVKWGLALYGREGRGWFVSCGPVRGAVRVTFFQGLRLRPVPPDGTGRLRAIVLHGADAFDARRIGSWVRQAARLPGFGS